MDDFLKKAVVFTIVLVVLISLALLIKHKLAWSIGFLVASAWSTINLLLTMRLFKIVILRQDKAKLTLFLFLKFPLLYALGGAILLLRWFPLWSLLAGLFPIFVVMGALKLCSQNLSL